MPLLTDHLGSTVLNVSAGLVKQAEVRYYAYGADRYTWGAMPTTYRYTGQRSDAGIGLYYYGARYYDPALGRFVQADSLPPPVGAVPLTRRTRGAGAGESTGVKSLQLCAE